MSNSDLYKEQITNAINAFSLKKYSKAEEICSHILSKNDNADANHIIGCIRTVSYTHLTLPTKRIV